MNRAPLDEHVELWAACAFFVVMGAVILMTCMFGALSCAIRSIWRAGAALCRLGAKPTKG